MRRILRTAILAAAALGLAGSGLVTAPAHAATEVVVQFSGVAQTDNLFFPGFGPGADDFSFESSSCTDVVVGGVKKPSGTGGCEVLAAGTFVDAGAGPVGFCSASIALGTAKVTTHDGHTYVIDFKFTSQGGTIEIVGTATKVTTGQTGTAEGHVLVSPATPTDCTSGGETTYTVTTGEITITVI